MSNVFFIHPESTWEAELFDELEESPELRQIDENLKPQAPSRPSSGTFVRVIMGGES
jgi:hypothetical protein